MVKKKAWNIIIVILLLFGSSFIGACSIKQTGEEDDCEDMAITNTDISEKIMMTIWGQPFIFDITVSAYDISCNRLTTEFPIDFAFDMPEGFSVTIDGNIVENNSYQYQISHTFSIF